MSLEKVEEVLGPEVRKAVEQPLSQSWDFEAALSEPWTHSEQNPPEISEFNDWLVNTKFTAHSDLIGLVDTCNQGFGHRSQKETARKLLRYGLPEFFSQYGGQLDELKRYNEAATTARNYVNNPGEYATLLR